MRGGMVLERIVDQGSRRNFLAFLGDYSLFGTALAFVSTSTVLPSLMRSLSASSPVIGLMETIHTGAWLLPQLFVARALSGKALRKRAMLVPLFFGRLTYPLFILLILLLSVSKPGLTAGLLLAGFAFFFFCDACGSIPWFDLFSILLSPKYRARLVGMGQVFSGISGIGAGFVVAGILGSPGISFPLNYALLFAISSGFMVPTLYFLSRLKEGQNQPVSEVIPFTDFIARLSTILRQNREFRRVVIVRLLAGFSGLATPFYIIFALEALRLPAESIGLFTAAQVIGGIVSAPLMAWLSEKRGTRSVIRLSVLLALLLPLIGLGAVAGASSFGSVPLLALFSALFFLLGAVLNGNAAGFLNYLLELAPTEDRPTYVGLANTLNGLILVAPFLGGWILAFSSFTTLFAATAAVMLVGLMWARWLSEPRR